MKQAFCQPVSRKPTLSYVTGVVKSERHTSHEASFLSACIKKANSAHMLHCYHEPWYLQVSHMKLTVHQVLQKCTETSKDTPESATGNTLFTKFCRKVQKTSKDTPESATGNSLFTKFCRKVQKPRRTHLSQPHKLIFHQVLQKGTDTSKDMPESGTGNSLFTKFCR